MAYSIIVNDAILLVIGIYFIPISMFDITFEEENEP
jgi:hypothetical protein